MGDLAGLTAQEHPSPTITLRDARFQKRFRDHR
jgi:hypothetical protein